MQCRVDKPLNTYLGVWIDKDLKMMQNVKKTARIMPNQDIPSSGKRRILVGVVHSVLMYEAPVWVDIVKVKKYRILWKGVKVRR